MMSAVRLGLGLICALLIAGCGSGAPRFDQSLEEARGAVQSAAHDPDVQQYARPELDLAVDAFAEAERNWRRGNDRDVIAHWAGLAQQRATAAREAASQRRAEAAAREAEAERQRRAVEVTAFDSEAARSGSADAMPPIDQPIDPRMGRPITVTLGDELFAPDGIDLDRQAEPTIERLVALLRQDPSRTARIEGHSDDLGSQSRNLELSGRRGDAVRAALIARGIDARRITVEALGDSAPVASNDTALGRARNRRVEVVIATPRQ
jgi:outer membrane protein OmpA-like peptidoglycan-associated protein